MKRKIIIPLCAALLILGGCGETNQTSNGNPSTSNTTTSSENTTDTTTEEIKTIRITNEVSNLFVGKTRQITYETNPSTSKVEFSCNEMGTISESGLFTASQVGKAVITIKIKDTEISNTYEFNVVDTLVNVNFNNDVWDYENVYNEENVSFKSLETIGNNLNSYTTINNIKSKKYAFSSIVKVSSPKGDDTWSRVSLGHVNDEGKFHGFFVSPGPDFNQRKTVVMDVVNGDVQWGNTTDRSQVWNQHDVNSLDMTNMKLTTIRDGNNYYYLINDELYWFESYFTDFNEIDTTPSFMAAQMQVEFSHITIETDTSKIDEMVNAVKNKKLYPSFKENVEVGENSIVFKNVGTAPQNAKDQAARSIGDALSMPSEKEAELTFDLKIDQYGATNPLPALAVTINRYDGFAEARSFVIGESKAGFTGWNSNGSLNEGIGDGGRLYTATKEDETTENVLLDTTQTYKITCTRLMNNGQDTKICVAKQDGTILLEYAHGWNDGYKGPVLLSFLARDINCTITNININVK